MQNNIDPVCGMNLEGFADLAQIAYKGNPFSFCGDHCKETFQKDPEKFQGQPLIRLNKVQKIFKTGGAETQVLRGLDFYVWEGDFISIIGASGSGKSTALNMIGLLDRPTSGKIFFKGNDTSSLDDEERAEFRSKTFGFVFQQYNLIPWLTAYENASLPFIFSGDYAKERSLKTIFEEIGLKDRATHRPSELSGGEQQRVALIRALSNDPEIIIADEPTGNLDSSTGNKILEMLIDLNKKKKKTLIVVTHDADIAEKADRIITIKDGQLARNHHARKIYTE